MKKIAITACTFLLVFVSVHAQTGSNEKSQKKEEKKDQKTERKALKNLEGTKVSEMAVNNFKADFGDLPNVHWKRNGTFDEALFTKDGKTTTAFYDIGSKLVGTTRMASLSDLPAKAQQDIKTKYKDYTPGPVILFDDNEANETDMIMYGVQFDDADNYFVELTKGGSKIVLKVNMEGIVYFFKQL